MAEVTVGIFRRAFDLLTNFYIGITSVPLLARSPVSFSTSVVSSFNNVSICISSVFILNMIIRSTSSSVFG